MKRMNRISKYSQIHFDNENYVKPDVLADRKVYIYLESCHTGIPVHILTKAYLITKDGFAINENIEDIKNDNKNYLKPQVVFAYKENAGNNIKPALNEYDVCQNCEDTNYITYESSQAVEVKYRKKNNRIFDKLLNKISKKYEVDYQEVRKEYDSKFKILKNLNDKANASFERQDKEELAQ